MFTTVEISYYPLSQDYEQPIDSFLAALSASGLEVEIGAMSTLVSGEYSDIMQTITKAMEKLMADYPSVFNLKISNACQVAKPNTKL